MNDQTIDQRVIQCICTTLDLREEEVTPEKNLEADLGCDSLDKLEIVMFMEEKFNCDIDDDDADRINTVQDALDLIRAMHHTGYAA